MHKQKTSINLSFEAIRMIVDEIEKHAELLDELDEDNAISALSLMTKEHICSTGGAHFAQTYSTEEMTVLERMAKTNAALARNLRGAA